MTTRKPLTSHRQAETAKPEDKPYKLAVGNGLFLQVLPSGSKRWRYRYFFDGKENMLSLGLFPQVGISAAKDKRDEAKKLLAQGINPSTQRKLDKDTLAESKSNTFQAVAADWLSTLTHRAEATKTKAQWLLDFAIKEFGHVAVNEITPPMVLAVSRKLEKQGKHETARRVKMKSSQVFRYAVGIGKCDRDPTADLRGLLTPPRVKHRAAIVEPEKLGVLLNAIDGYQGRFITHYALKLAPILFVRPGELRSMKWADIDFDKATWAYTPPKTRNQTGVELIVPLPKQAMEILRSLLPITGKGDYVFASSGKEGYLSESAILMAIKKIGYAGEVTGHGFRATARTLLDEALGFRVEYIEMQLGHEVRDVHGRAYNRTKYLPERVAMMQAWADYLDGLRCQVNKPSSL